MRLLHIPAPAWRLAARLPTPSALIARSRWERCSLQRASTSRPPVLDLPAIDQKWQQRWQEARPTPASDGPANPKAYVLAMFPYPSGALHMGHLRNYAVADVLARFRHMQGHSVLHPMGWDAFGLPAENAAIERGVHPAQWTKDNTARMRAQLQAMNSGMDWSKEFTTCDPQFYKHTQRLFLLLHEHGLAYQAEALVNYDPIDRTVLANEQVDANGYSWRSGAKVEQIKLRQWFLKITAFRESLLADLELLGYDDRWPDRVLAMQRHWLGKSTGARIKFDIIHQTQHGDSLQSVEVFTTRPDTLFGAQYLALSPSHPIVTKLAQRFPDLNTFISGVSSLPPDSKAGFQLPGVHGLNPLSKIPTTGHSVRELLPVFVAPYVLADYGSGAVMGVPGHDARDIAFWKENRPEDPIRRVVLPKKDPAQETNGPVHEAFVPLGYLAPSCHPFNGLRSEDAVEKILFELAEHKCATKAETWRLRDWLISRQRYWGTPIPIIHCHKCGAVPVPVDQLPVELPAVHGTSFKSRSGNPLESSLDWISTPCPSCGSPAKRDTDTMDTFMDSSWYFFRFTDPKNQTELFAAEKANSAMPVDVYIGGIEHAILHLLYARFISKFLTSVNLWPGGNDPDVRGEPFRKLISQGMVHGKTYSDPQTGRFLRSEELDFSDPNNPKIMRSNMSPNVSFEKMSKSKYNGVEPSSFIAQYGADVTRAHILFQAPVTEVLEWEEDRIVGIQRWFQRIWRLVNHVSTLVAQKPPEANEYPDPTTYNDTERTLHNAVHDTIASMEKSLSETYALNTCISDLMQLTNHLVDHLHESDHKLTQASIRPQLLGRSTQTLVRLLAPIAPAFASECWERLVQPGRQINANASLHYSDVFEQSFPTSSSTAKLAPKNQTCVVMENGRRRFETALPIPPDGIDNDDLSAWVLEQLRKTTEGKAWFKSKGEVWDRIVVVKAGRTVNFVGHALRNGVQR